VRAKSGSGTYCRPRWIGGKTTTLYTLLDQLDHTKLSITTVEEKVEHHFSHIAQTQTKPEIGLTTLAGLRAVLKQDPDVVAIGDLTDAETAQLALHAASAGVLVFACVDAPTAGEAIETILASGISPRLIAATLKGVIAVDVVRAICPMITKSIRLRELREHRSKILQSLAKCSPHSKTKKLLISDTQWKGLIVCPRNKMLTLRRRLCGTAGRTRGTPHQCQLLET
jgi:type II secretory ATPase GspE/PulE/Tfp pilus assembly ATPase PilB-like protein